MNNVNEGPNHPLAPTIPNMVFCTFQMMFATVTPAIVFSGAAERLKMVPYMVFITLWSIIVYDFVAYWAWAPNGWFHSQHSLLFFFALSLFQIFEVDLETHFNQHKQRLEVSIMLVEWPLRLPVVSPVLVLLALWAAAKSKSMRSTTHHSSFWALPSFGLDGLGSMVCSSPSPTLLLLFHSLLTNSLTKSNNTAGSAGGANARAAAAGMHTHLIACLAALTWMICHWLYTRKWSVLAVCSGAVAGMVCATPAAGYIGIHSCLAFGVIAGVVCWAATFLNKKLKVDDTFWAFACHGIGGFIGLLLTGIFADKEVIRLDGTCTDSDNIPTCQPGGWVNRHFIQLPIQLAGACAAAAWSICWSYVIIRIMRFTSRRTNLKEKNEGDLDMKVLGDPGYGFLRDGAEAVTPHMQAVEEGTIPPVDLKPASTTAEAPKPAEEKPAAAAAPAAATSSSTSSPIVTPAILAVDQRHVFEVKIPDAIH